jgi:23S rRNA pseudouridine955/2504/2580 synthase
MTKSRNTRAAPDQRRTRDDQDSTNRRPTGRSYRGDDGSSAVPAGRRERDDQSSRPDSRHRSDRDQSRQRVTPAVVDSAPEEAVTERRGPLARGPARAGGRPSTHQRRRPVDAQAEHGQRKVDPRERLLQQTLSDEHEAPSRMAPMAAVDDEVADENAWQQVTWFSVTEYQEGQRLDNFLINRLKGVPKTRIYRLIREGEVRVNKGRVRADTRLQVGDQIRVAPIRRHMHNDKSAPVIGADLASGLAARIVFEDEGLIVLNKPAGLAVHGGSGIPFGVIEALRQALGKSYLELVHRIDRDTSGLLMISKKRSTLKRLQDDLRDGRIRKTYTAIVKGNVLLDKQTVDMPLLRHELPSGERRVRVSNEGKSSQTDVKVLERLGPATLIEASPLTGRTHQIRVHAQAIGHPLVGDDKYGHERAYDGPNARRLSLHATRLQVPGYEQVFEAPMPEDMNALLAQLRGQSPEALAKQVSRLKETPAQQRERAMPKADAAVIHPDMDLD